ncbi:hypothetical protein ASPBRDRAFT_48816 [Aspergillus brasiliensis CBS 101740]|uniref:Uncharacterized protein n=1 Tax=Aspergillus brasiliensis (strain CBS 101740 / IMI 381727 / IBT 21946) TaxID=767769 RepID=A0A1L9U4M8_ASPBC|nr:hypothetical protein ASPBRDRAFT_48816 [Aspergillus brasiliensis CBS 101740]
MKDNNIAVFSHNNVTVGQTIMVVIFPIMFNLRSAHLAQLQARCLFAQPPCFYSVGLENSNIFLDKWGYSKLGSSTTICFSR